MAGDGTASDRKHPCPDCKCCQWCSDDRCRLCRRDTRCSGRKLSIAEQIARYESLNRPDTSGPEEHE